MHPTIMTVSGRYFNIAEPETTPVTVTEIAHALSHICRYTGHTARFYSVAQHSVAVSHLVPPEHALAGLMHDAAEAFIGDVSSPLKRMLPDYQVIEKRVEAAVFACFGLPPHLHESVKWADLVMLAAEKRDLLPAHGPSGAWDVIRNVIPRSEVVKPQRPEDARQSFLDRYHDLVGFEEVA